MHDDKNTNDIFIMEFEKRKKIHILFNIIFIISTFLTLISVYIIIAFTYFFMIFIPLTFFIVFFIFHLIYKNKYWRCPKCGTKINGEWSSRNEYCPRCKLPLNGFDYKKDGNKFFMYH